MNWLLQNARLPGESGQFDLLLERGKVRLLPPGSDPEGVDRWNLEGRLVLPGLADMHVHLDKTYSDFSNQSGTLRGAIESFRQTLATRTEQDVYDRAERGLRAAIRAGVTRMRSHINLGSAEDLALFSIISSLRERYQAAIELQLVGMVSVQLLNESPEVVSEAQAAGMDLLGGCPALEGAPLEAVQKLVTAGSDFQLPLDLHIDETEDPDSRTLVALAETVMNAGFSLPVTAGHCCSLAFMSPAERAKSLTQVKQAGITMVTLPMCNLVLMGREIEPKPRGVAPAREILAAGIPLCAGSDNVHDPFNPFGNYDPLVAMQLTVLAGQLTDQQSLASAFDLVTDCADPHFSGGGRIADGVDADLVVLDETDAISAVVNPPARLATFKSGQLIVQTEKRERWHV